VIFGWHDVALDREHTLVIGKLERLESVLGSIGASPSMTKDFRIHTHEIR
jgi:hypothetical protein